jgi:hypothetical protein
MLKTFKLERKVDVSGVSGCGIVALGVMFSDGQCALHWEGSHSSINIYHSLEDLLFVHSHNGASVVVFDDTTDEKKTEK